MSELDTDREAILIDCLRALDAGATVEDCLARYPQHADSLRPALELRTRLSRLPQPEPPPAAYAAGRQALLERLAAQPRAARRLALPSLLPQLPFGRYLQSPLTRTAALGVLLLVLGGGALSASAAAGVGPVRDALSALPVIELSSAGEGDGNPNADEGPGNSDDGIGNADDSADPGDHANPRAGEGGATPDSAADDHRPCLPSELLDRVPGLQELFEACVEGEEHGGPPDGTPGNPNAPGQGGPDVQHTPGQPDDRGTPQGPPDGQPGNGNNESAPGQQGQPPHPTPRSPDDHPGGGPPLEPQGQSEEHDPPDEPPGQSSH